MSRLSYAITAVAVAAQNHVHDLWTRRDDRGSYTTETVIVMVALAALALTAMGTLGPKIIAKMQSIDLGG